MKSKRLPTGIWFGWLMLAAALGAAPGTAVADDYDAQWGPPIGSRLPVLEAFDQAGNLRNLDNLSGEQGLLLFLSRSADW